MKKLLGILLALMIVLPLCVAMAEETPAIEYVEIPLDAEITVKGNFSAKYVVEQGDSAKIDGGLMFYRTDANWIGFKVRRESAARVDFYGTKVVEDKWKGFLIAEEYREWMKDCFVSVDEGWDATEDKNITMIITVEDGIATVTIQGDVTGKEGTVHFDLSKSPWLDWEEKEAEPLVLTEGTIFFDMGGGGKAIQLFIDKDTYDANQI